MEDVLTSSGIRSSDRFAVRTLGIPALILMENAGKGVAQGISQLLGVVDGKSITIVCGKGKNGGDGFVAARHLLGAGATVRVILIARRTELRGETLRNFSILQRLASQKDLRHRMVITEGFRNGRQRSNGSPSLVVDAMFGTGFHGKLKGTVRKAAEWINKSDCPIVAVDIPSGLDSDTGAIDGTCVSADLTVTMGALKTGLLIGRGPDVCGQIEVTDLGFSIAPSLHPEDRTFQIRGEDIPDCLPRRARDAHKHSVGKILVCAGSVGLTGAAALAASAAMRSGAGAVILAVPQSLYPLLARKLTEVMVKPVPESTAGTFCASSLDALKKELEWADVVLMGPGLGMNLGVHDFLENLLKLKNKRLLIDADGLNHIAADRSLLRHLRHNTTILTPHPGEFSRLSGYSAIEIEKGRISLAREFAVGNDLCLVLKGSPTVTASSDGSVFINSTGNPGMASAGMGDVLSGVIAAIWAETDQILESAYGGAFLHGWAGDLVAASFGARSLMAGDVINKIPEVITSFEFNQ